MTAAAAADEMYWKLACSQVCPRRYHTCQHGAMWNSAKHIRTEKEQDEMIVHSCYVTGRHAKPGRDISSAMPLLFVFGVFFVHGKSQAFPSRDFLDMNLKALCLLFQKKKQKWLRKLILEAFGPLYYHWSWKLTARSETALLVCGLIIFFHFHIWNHESITPNLGPN